MVPDGPFAAGFDEQTTNQRMELTAVLEAMRSLDGPLDVVSDSTYVVNCFRDRWWEGWLARDWKNSQRKPVANRDLWEPIIDGYRSRDISFRWVKGHSGDPWNDVADRLAVAAGERQESRSGNNPPSDLGAEDPTTRKKPAPTGSRELPDGHVMLITGHRPPELGGYEDNPTLDALHRKLVDVIAAKRSLHPDLLVITGMNLGTEIIGARAAVDVAIPLVPVLAYPDYDSVWPEASKRAFAQLLEHSERVLTLQRKVPSSRQQAGAAQARRDAWLQAQADEAVVVWNGEEGAVAKTTRSLMSELGEENVWIIDPAEL